MLFQRSEGSDTGPLGDFSFLGRAQKRYEIQSCFIWNLWINRLTTMRVSWWLRGKECSCDAKRRVQVDPLERVKVIVST